MLQTNCTLTRVQGASGGETYDGPAAAGAEKWAGSVLAYLRETRQRTQSAGGDDIVLDRVLLVETSDPAVDWTVGDVVTFTRLSGEVITAPVRIVQRPEISDPDIPAEIVTVRLTLEPA